MTFRRAICAVAATAAVAAAMLCLPPAARAGGPSCGTTTVVEDSVVFKILFAKNGAVQQYVIMHSENTEQDHDARLKLEARYGKEGIDAPPLSIKSFKPAPGGGMMLPDKAIDSCGREISFTPQ